MTYFRAYSFWHLKSGILKTVELADFAEKNAKRIRILKTVGLADFAEKNAKRMGMEC